MTKARTIADLGTGFVNISDTGTAGTKVASGTTAQRGSTAGQIRFNTTTGLAEYYTGTEFKSIDTPPTITSIDITNIETSLGGTQTFVITGTLFNSGATVKFRDNGGTLITPDTTTVNSSTQITVTKTRSSFSNANEPYDIIVTNPSNLSGTLENQINVDNSPTWSTASGSLGTIYSDSTGNHFTVSATDPDGDTVSYSETGGTVLSTQGLTLNSSSGVISGDPVNVASNTTLSFNLRATGNSKFADRAFSILLRPPITINTFDIFADNSAIAFYKFDTNGNDLGGNYNATIGGSASITSTDGKFGGFASATTSSYASGVTYIGDALSNQLRPSTQFSYSWWFKKPASGDVYMTVNGSQCWWYWYLRKSGNANEMSVLHYNSGSGNNIAFSGTYTDVGTWVHACITNNPNGQTKLYANNVLIGSASSTTSTANYDSGDNRITFCADNGIANSCDHVRIFNRELTAGEVSQLYNEVG